MFKSTMREKYHAGLCEKCMQNESTVEAVSTDNKLIYICGSC